MGKISDFGTFLGRPGMPPATQGDTKNRVKTYVLEALENEKQGKRIAADRKAPRVVALPELLQTQEQVVEIVRIVAARSKGRVGEERELRPSRIEVDLPAIELHAEGRKEDTAR